MQEFFVRLSSKRYNKFLCFQTVCWYPRWLFLYKTSLVSNPTAVAVHGPCRVLSHSWHVLHPATETDGRCRSLNLPQKSALFCCVTMPFSDGMMLCVAITDFRWGRGKMQLAPTPEVNATVAKYFDELIMNGMKGRPGYFRNLKSNFAYSQVAQWGIRQENKK